MISMMIPERIIFVIGTIPDAYTMALGGVDTGIIKPKEDANATPTATGIGLKPNETAVPMAMEPMRLMAAVWEVNSANNRQVTQKTATKSISEG